MTNFSKKTNIQEIITVTLVYLSFFIVGILSYQDFGISVDEFIMIYYVRISMQYFFYVPQK